MWRQIIYVVLALLILGCSPISYQTYYQAKQDPTFDFGGMREIGLVPLYWSRDAKQAGVDPLAEKQLLAYFKTELEKRGYRVWFVDPDDCESRGGEIMLRQGLDKYPDATLTIIYGQQSGSIEVPSSSSGYFNWGEYYKGGGYQSTGPYSASIWGLYIGATVWAETPNYDTPVWQGSVIKGSPGPDLFDKAPGMIAKLMKSEKFPVAGR